MHPLATPPLILASASPRRRDLLRSANVEFEVIPADIPELQQAGERASDFVRRLAAEKARAVRARIAARSRRLVLAADTVVVVDDTVLGKPDDVKHASSLLQQILGRTHRVITGVAILDTASDSVWEIQVESEVQMRSASEEEREAYAASGEGLDKAGAYALQGEGRKFVVRVIGSESNVIGLPLPETLELLKCARAALL